MFGKSLRISKNLQLLGVRAQVKAMLRNGQNVDCGVVGADTKLILRSRSSRIFWLIQMSTEMWEFDENGEIYYEKLLNRFIRVLFDKWKTTAATHTVTIILFSRSFYSNHQFPEDFDPESPLFRDVSWHGHGPGCTSTGAVPGYIPTIQTDSNGRYFEDFYHVVVQDLTSTDWGGLLRMLKLEIAQYHRMHRWTVLGYAPKARYTFRTVTDSFGKMKRVVQWDELPRGVPSRAQDGNALEAINVTLNMLDKHYMDRDLHHTGQTIVMITAGCGVFKVTRQLAYVTKQRMMDNGVGMDMVSLSTPPLHGVPLFSWQKTDAESDNIIQEGSAFAANEHYTIPHWINMTFLDLECNCVHECNCAVTSKFRPLPPYRMFDITNPTSSQAFPATLRNLIAEATDGIFPISSPTREHAVEDIIDRMSSFEMIESPSSPFRIRSSRRISMTSSTPPSDRAHSFNLQGSPDFSGGALTYEDLQQYDKNVFCLPKTIAGTIGRLSGALARRGSTTTAAPGSPEMTITSGGIMIDTNAGDKLNHIIQQSIAASWQRATTFRNTPTSGSIGSGSPPIPLSTSYETCRRPRSSRTEANSDADLSARLLSEMPDDKENKTVSKSNETPVKHSLMASSPASESVKRGGSSRMNQTMLSRQGAAVNPFNTLATDWESSQRLTSNRRRWVHLFPISNSVESKKMHSGPNWLSLTCPAVLPLTTDFYPNPNDLRAMYTESFYTLTLSLPSESTIPSYRSHHELVLEMVSQRLSQDFQLVETNTGGTIDRRRKKRNEGVVYHLSMGHRIHQIIYDEELQTIEVKRYVRRFSGNEENTPYVYRYSLWVKTTDSFHPNQQEFHQFSGPEYNWNFMDQLLCGYYDTMPENTKCRRIRFCIVPPPLETVEDESQYVPRFQKFIEYVQSRIGSNGSYHVTIVSSFQRDSTATDTAKPTESFKIAMSTTRTRQEWLILQSDLIHETSRSFQFELRWLACSSTVIDDFVSSLQRKCKQNGIQMQRVPEYCRSSFLKIHPFLTPIYLPWPISLNGRLVEAELVNRFGFLFDEEKLCDSRGMGLGLGIPPEIKSTTPFRRYRLTVEALMEKRRTRGYRQYMHRTLRVFVRVTYCGIVWIPSRQYDRESDHETSELYDQLESYLDAVIRAHEMMTLLIDQTSTLL